MQTSDSYANAVWNTYLITHKAKAEKRWPWRCGAGLILPTAFIHSVCFVLAAAAGLKIKLAKQINHMMRRLADCCRFFPLRFIGIFPLLPFFPPEVAAFSPQGSLWTGPDVPGSTLPHSLPHGIFMGNQAPQHSTAQHRAAETRDHLFIYFITLLPGCLMHKNSWTYKSIFSPSCFS